MRRVLGLCQRKKPISVGAHIAGLPWPRPRRPDGTELQLALNGNPAATAYQQAMFFNRARPRGHVFSPTTSRGDYERIKARAAPSSRCRPRV